MTRQDIDLGLTTRLALQMPYLRRYAHDLGHNALEVEDLLRESLLRALAPPSRLAPTTLRPALFAILHNLHLERRRAGGHSEAGRHSEALGGSQGQGLLLQGSFASDHEVVRRALARVTALMPSDGTARVIHSPPSGQRPTLH